MKPTLAFLATMTLGAAAMAQLPAPDQLPDRAELPDPLVALDGSKIKDKDAWLAKRKPELKRLFQHYEYGYFPEKPDNVTFKVERVDPKALGGKATLKEVTISFGPPETPKVRLLLVIPNKRTGPAPVFLGLNFYGNHATINDPNVALPTGWVPAGKGVTKNRATDAGRGTNTEAWSMEQVIDAGYAIATVYCGDIVSDRSDVKEGIQNTIKSGQAAAHDWGAIAAWAWGLQRCIDYLVIDGDVDAARIIVMGHSRLGKTALLAAAFDERAAMVIPNQAGCGGTGPSRSAANPKAETVAIITKRFPHWFAPTFAKFGSAVEKLPIDQHCLIALMAPRPVLLNNAVEDQWANPDGQFDMLVAADPVYKLLGSEGLAVKKRPEIGQLVSSPLGYRIRAGKHSVTADDWRAFVEYANVRLPKK